MKIRRQTCPARSMGTYRCSTKLLRLLVVIFFSLFTPRLSNSQTVEGRFLDLVVNGGDSAQWWQAAELEDSDSPWRHFAMGMVFQGRGDYGMAERELLLAFDELEKSNKLGSLLVTSQLGAHYAKKSDHEKGRPFYLRCIEKAKDYPAIYGHCVLNYASERRHRSDYDSALFLLNSAIDIFTENGLDEGLGMSMMNVGTFYHHHTAYDSAMHYYLKSISIFEQTRNLRQLSKAYNNMAIIATSVGNIALATDYTNKAIDIRTKTNDFHGMAASYSTLGNLYLSKQQWDSASIAFNLSNESYQRLGDKKGMMWSENNIANAAYYAGDFQLAFDHFNQARLLATEIKDTAELSRINSNLGWSYISLGKVKESKAFFDAGLDLAMKCKELEVKEIAYIGLSDYYIAIGNYEKALESYAKSRDIRDQIVNEKLTQQFAEMQTKYDTEKKEREIADLAKEKAIAEVKISNQRGWIIGIVLGVMMIAAVGAIVFVQRKRKSEVELATKELEFRKQLLDATVLAEENERQRIAKDLHDGLVQTLAVLKLGVQSAMNKVGLTDIQKPEFAQHIQQIDAAADEARSISHQMMPRVLMESGLIVALEDMLHKTLGNTSISYDFEQFHLGETRFETRIEVSVYRICQEMVNNIIKHSAAKSVSLQLFKTKTHLVLHIEDDGLGFDLNDRQRPSGIGLSNIFSRASAVNGEVNFEKGQPKGTVANVRIPIV
ncbi:MAG: tetratricopeptide repeat protein [Flavobacteriales bacterium]